MFGLYLIVVATTTTAALIWRSLLLDHPRLLSGVEGFPLIGGALTCGFCSAVWLSLAAALCYDPIAPLLGQMPTIEALWTGWFTIAAGVLFARNLIATLLEGSAVLYHLHMTHEEEE